MHFVEVLNKYSIEHCLFDNVWLLIYIYIYMYSVVFWATVNAFFITLQSSWNISGSIVDFSLCFDLQHRCTTHHNTNNSHSPASCPHTLNGMYVDLGRVHSESSFWSRDAPSPGREDSSIVFCEWGEKQAYNITTETFACIYRVIHKSLRNFRTRLRNNQERHGRKEHINR